MCAKMYRCIHLHLYVFAHELKMQRRASRFIHAYKSTFTQKYIYKKSENFSVALKLQYFNATRLYAFACACVLVRVFVCVCENKFNKIK